MRVLSRRLYPLLAALYLTGVVAQFFLAGMAFFSVLEDASHGGGSLTVAAIDDMLRSHFQLGSILDLAPLVLITVALIGRLGGRTVRIAVSILALVWVQTAFSALGPPGVRAVHVVLGLVLLVVAAYATWDALHPADHPADQGS